MTVFELENYLYCLKNKLNPDEGRHGLKGSLNPDEGIIFGDPGSCVSAIQVSWAANLEAIENARGTGADLMLVHEDFLIPPPGTADRLSWPANRLRIEALSRYGISVVRFHGTLDGICVFDDFAEALGLAEASVKESGYIKLYDIEPVSIDALTSAIKEKLGMERARVVIPFSPPEKIKRIALPWGGMGLSVNSGYQAELMRHNPDAFISGEADCFAMHFAADSGIYIIETGHEISENIGIKNFSERISGELEDVKVSYFENKPPFRYA